jgi:hypothetical protein
MTRSRRAKRITGRAYMVLAALLLADGAWVTQVELANELFDQPTVRMSICWHIADLRRLGVPEVETLTGWGTRLTAVPADEHLEPMLACVPAVKRSAWWRTHLARTRTQAS